MTQAPQRDRSTEPAVTIVVPSYNSAECLPTALASISAQTVQDLEILVIDDGSTQLPVTQEMLAHEPRAVLHALPENIGYGAVTNYAIKAARGEWIFFVDADDEIEPWCVERLLARGREEEADIVLMPLMCRRGGRRIGPLAFPREGQVLTPAQAAVAWARHELVLSEHCLLRRPRPDAPEGYTFSDAVHVLAHITRARRIALLHEPGYIYNVHAGSTTGTLRPNIIELMQMPARTADSCRAVTSGRQRQELLQLVSDYTVSQVLHKAAREARPTPLRRDVEGWCRARVTVRGVLRHLRRRQFSAAASWMLFLISPALHRRMYTAYDRSKDRRASRTHSES